MIDLVNPVDTLTGAGREEKRNGSKGYRKKRSREQVGRCYQEIRSHGHRGCTELLLKWP